MSTSRGRRTRRSKRRAVPLIPKAISQRALIQGDVISGSQLVELGWSRQTLKTRKEQAVVRDLGGDVFAFGFAAVSDKGRRHAAVLAAGPGAALSHDTAAFMWSLVDKDPRKIHVSTRRTNRRGTRDSHMHRPRKLPASDITTRDGHRITTIFRTLSDHAAKAAPAKLRRMIEQAVTRHNIDPVALAKYARRTKGRPGSRKLADAARAVIGPVRLRSNLESAFRTLCENAGFPQYEANRIKHGVEMDVYWEFLNLAIELDWWTYHGGKTPYRKDRKKSSRLVQHGIQMHRIAGEDMEEDEREVVETVRAILKLAGWSPTMRS